ncbi:MAG: hypothetical protein WCJ25_05585 [Candidatus Moraniibacteriota bacterium]
MSKRSRSKRRVILSLRDILNLFLGKDIFKGEGSLESRKTLERLHGLFEESRYDEVAEICRQHLSRLPRFRERIRKDMNELESVIRLILLKSKEDPTGVEEEWYRLGKILSRMEKEYGRRFHIRSIPSFRSVGLETDRVFFSRESLN